MMVRITDGESLVGTNKSWCVTMKSFALILLLCLPALGVGLIWDDSPDHDETTQYNLYQSADASNWRRVAITTTNFVAAKLFPGSNYFIVTISRLNGADESEPSNTLGVKGFNSERTIARRVAVQTIVIGR